MCNLAVAEVIFIFSIAFQLSAAILLIIKSCMGSIEKRFNNLQKKETHVEGSTLILGQTAPSKPEFSENVWINRIAFIFLAIGYLLTIWAEIKQTNRWCIFGGVVILTIVFICVSLCVSKCLSKRK